MYHFLKTPNAERFSRAHAHVVLVSCGHVRVLPCVHPRFEKHRLGVSRSQRTTTSLSNAVEYRHPYLQKLISTRSSWGSPQRCEACIVVTHKKNKNGHNTIHIPSSRIFRSSTDTLSSKADSSMSTAKHKPVYMLGVMPSQLGIQAFLSRWWWQSQV